MNLDLDNDEKLIALMHGNRGQQNVALQIMKGRKWSSYDAGLFWFNWQQREVRFSNDNIEDWSKIHKASIQRDEHYIISG